MCGNLFRAGRGESVASLIINRVTGVVRNDTPRPLNLAKLQRMRFSRSQPYYILLYMNVLLST